jgi:hypothetical protein
MKMWGLSLVLALSFCSTATAQDKEPHQVASAQKGRKQALLITLEVRSETVKVGSPIGAKMTMTNISRKPVDVGFGSWESWGLIVRDSQGNEPLTEMERCLRTGGPCNSSSNPWGPCPAEDKECGELIGLPMRGGPSGIMLAPGKSDSGPAERNLQVYDLTRPGKYFLQYEVRYSEDLVFKSNIVTVTLVP